VEIFDVTISSQGQVTVPVVLRRRLGLEKGDKLRFVADEHGVRVTATPWTLDTIIGSVSPGEATSESLDGRVADAVSDDLSARMPWASRS
jgi:AbrB family looped-hinge helix DNA binding protein